MNSKLYDTKKSQRKFLFFIPFVLASVLIFSVCLFLRVYANEGKILVVALDDRPVNIDYPLLLAEDGVIEISSSLNKNTLEERLAVLKKEVRSENYSSVVISWDNLLYGGLMESRVVENHLSEYEKSEILRTLDYLKKNKIKIYGFTTSQRVTTNVNSNEDMDLYNASLENNTILTTGNFKSDNTTGFELNDNSSDYYNHRVSKLKDTKFILEKTATYFEILYVGQDDTQASGIQKFELHNLKNVAKSKSIQFVNGTDELTVTLIYKILKKPSNNEVYVYKTDESISDTQILAFEGKTLNELLTEKVEIFDMEIKDTPSDAEYIWIIHNGDKTKINTSEIEELVKTGKPILVSDLNISNNENQLLRWYFENDVSFLNKITAYSSWNTASNLFGLTLSQGFLSEGNPNNAKLLEKRIVKDYFYKTVLQQSAKIKFPELAAQQYGIHDKELERYLTSEMNRFLKETLKSSNEIENVYLPWGRFFEATIIYK